MKRRSVPVLTTLLLPALAPTAFAAECGDRCERHRDARG